MRRHPRWVRGTIAAPLDRVATHQPVSHPLVERQRPRVKHHSKVRQFFSQLVKDCIADNITDVGAMMAYYAVLSLFPMVVFIVTLALLVLPSDSIMQGLQMVTDTMPGATREVIVTQVTKLIDSAHAGFAIGGAAIALWGASRGAASLMTALNAMYGKRESRAWWKRQLIAIGVTFAVALLVVIALALLVVGPPAGHWLADRFGLGSQFDLGWAIGRWVGAGLLVMVVWAILYKFLPDTDAPFRIFTPGAVAGVAVWLGISYGFGLYLSHFNSYATTYGALGGAIIFLTWLWLSNISLLLGAEINDVLADVRKADSPAAAKLADEREPTPP